MPVVGGSASAHQASYEVVCEVLRGVLVDSVQAGPGPGGTGSIRCRVSGALYALLMTHPIDHRGRCRSCRRPGAVLGFARQRCRVHRQVHYWLRQPDALLHAQLAQECGPADPSPAQRSQSPVVSSALPPREAPRVGQPVSTHGGTGAYPPIAPGPTVVHPATRISLTGSLVHTGGAR